MKQNIYDDPVFYEGYHNLREHEAGLNAAIEEPAVVSVLPKLDTLDVLDLGCGFGDFCRFARCKGAVKVVGVDISKKMIAEAVRRTNDPGITYIHAAIEDYLPEEKAYDLTVSRLALHYVSDYRGVVSLVYRALREDGHFILSIEHPICTARCRGWHEDADGNQLFWPVDDYGREGERKQHWFIDGVVKYHRTVETYVNTLLEAGFRLTRLLEPQAAGSSLGFPSDSTGAARRPPLLVIAVKKPAGSGRAARSGHR